MFKSGGKLHWVKNLYQRWWYGAGCCDIFNADYYLAKKIIKPLKRFRRNMGGYPGEFKTIEEWEKKVDEMIWAFEFLLNGEVTKKEDGTEEYYNQEDCKKAQEGFELFGKYFRNLWI